VKAWRSRDSFEPGSNLKAWLFTILRNTFLSERRKRKFEVADADGKLAEQMSVKAEQAGHMDLIDFSKAFATLPEEQREALILVGAEGFAYEEAAQMCGCAVGTIKSRVNRARSKLVDLLGVAGAADFAADDMGSSSKARSR
ncbi:MAG: sigma-70 family RNA polymerase sigma factor, partial [Proteobacteria bacterium]|nr:sigma-70 family RNA polymerase sigma factor [Pseudomonadota bacterium]